MAVLFKRTLILLSFAVFAPLSTGAAWARVPLETYAARPWMGQPQISPSGEHIAVPLSGKHGDTIAVLETEAPPGAKIKGITLVSQAQVAWVRWGNDNRLLVALTIRSAAQVGTRLVDTSRSFVLAIDRDGSNRRELFADRVRFPGNRDLAEIVDELPDDPNAILMDAIDSTGRDNLYRVDIYTGAVQLVERGGFDTTRWLTDPHGVARARWDFNSRRDLFQVFVRREGDESEWDKVAEYGARDFPLLNFVGFGDDPRIAIVASRQTSDRYGLFEYDIARRTIGKLLFQHDVVDVGEPLGGPLYDPVSGLLVGAYFVDDSWHRHYFNSDLAALQKRIDDQFPGAPIVTTPSWSRDRRRVIVKTSGPTDPGSYYVFNADKESVSPIGKSHPNIPPEELGKTQPLSFMTRDKVRIPGYLTMPPQKSAKNLPLVVMPHGGPESRDYPQFDHWVQMLANRGYAVFEPNFRGSGGYGKAFAEAGYHQWGRRMQDDVTDGVKALIADGTVDPSRICIVGASYGGYAALAGGAFTPELYKCIVAIAGVSHLPEMLDSLDSKLDDDSALYRYWVRSIGDPSSNRKELEATSPALHADRFRAPVLLMHGDTDEVVPYDQSRIMNQALKQAGKDVTLVTFKREGHNFSYGYSDLEVLTELERFLGYHLGN